MAGKLNWRVKYIYVMWRCRSASIWWRNRSLARSHSATEASSCSHSLNRDSVAWRNKRFCLLKYYSDEKQKDKNLIQNVQKKMELIHSFSAWLFWGLFVICGRLHWLCHSAAGRVAYSHKFDTLLIDRLTSIIGKEKGKFLGSYDSLGY